MLTNICFCKLSALDTKLKTTSTETGDKFQNILLLPCWGTMWCSYTDKFKTYPYKVSKLSKIGLQREKLVDFQTVELFDMYTVLYLTPTQICWSIFLKSRSALTYCLHIFPLRNGLREYNYFGKIKKPNSKLVTGTWYNKQFKTPQMLNLVMKLWMKNDILLQLKLNK